MSKRRNFKEEFDDLEQTALMWQYGMLGGFKTTLMKLISIADTSNLMKLSKSFPHEVLVYTMYVNTEGWWQDVDSRYRKWRQEGSKEETV